MNLDTKCCMSFELISLHSGYFKTGFCPHKCPMCKLATASAVTVSMAQNTMVSYLLSSVENPWMYSTQDPPGILMTGISQSWQGWLKNSSGNRQPDPDLSSHDSSVHNNSVFMVTVVCKDDVRTHAHIQETPSWKDQKVKINTCWRRICPVSFPWHVLGCL